MRHYEIICMIHPDHSDKVVNIIEKYKSLIKENNGIIHRIEDWGRKQLAYSINKLHKAHYLLMNIEISPNLIHVIETHFRFNSCIIRNIILAFKKAITEPSPMLKVRDDRRDKKDSSKILLVSKKPTAINLSK